MGEKKMSVITSPAFAWSFTLFSVACTAFFVLSDHRPSSLSLLFPPSTSSPPFTGPLTNHPVSSLNIGSIPSRSDKGNTVNPPDSPSTSSPVSGRSNGSDFIHRSADSVNSRSFERGSGKGKTVNPPDSPATSSPDVPVRSPNGSVSRVYSADSLSDSGKGKSVNLPDSPATSSLGIQVRGSNGSVSGKFSADVLSNGNVESGEGKRVNSTVNGKMVNAGLLDNHQDKVSNGSVIGFLSNSSVSLLDKKDGHFRENYDSSRTDSSVLSNSSINLSHSNGTVESGSEKGKTVNNSSSNSTNQTVKTVNQGKGDLWEKMKGCDFFDGNWVKDESYPLYKAGSCPHIDEPFDCFRNGRPDNDYAKFRWQPKGCNIPRLNGRDLLEMIRGKRLVYVGDSLNRNMWESMVCTLRNAVKDKRRVFEASGKRDFRTEHSYSFIFRDYNCSVEFFRSTFLVREWDVADTNGLKQETLRLDMVARSFNRFKDADILVFNTGHWWTHEKTAKGKGYYQEGSHVYDELNVMEAFRRAMTTWGRWIDNNINPKKTLVIFRGYSASHFSGGQWNSGGQCDSETVPIKNETYLKGYPSKMIMFEKVMRGMSTPILLLNVTKMTDFRKDAHPSVYRSQHLTEEERKSPLRFQDCSHWCLPGVPETWNELLYAQIFTKFKL